MAVDNVDPWLLAVAIPLFFFKKTGPNEIRVDNFRVPVDHNLYLGMWEARPTAG